MTKQLAKLVSTDTGEPGKRAIRDARPGHETDPPRLPISHTKPCGECPFRRASWAGYTGGNPPEWYTESALADFTGYGLAPCHSSATEAVPLGTVACAGALIFAKNLCKSPRDPDRAEAVLQVEADREAVFSSPDELIEHHRSGSFRSWE